MKISGIVAVMAIVGLSGGPRAEAQRTGKPALLPAGWPRFTRAFDAFAAGDSIVGASTLLLRDGRIWRTTSTARPTADGTRR